MFNPDLYFDAYRPRRGKAYTFAAGQLDNVYHFDANFFGISPRAAVEMEPQQRLMLQSVWEAVQDGGLDIKDLAGDRTGVFVGASLVEMLPKYYLDPARGGSNFVLGNTLSVIANRVSSVFDFGGPSNVLDTACSSGLYALHQASDAIGSGAIDIAIVGGVHVVRTPGGFVGFSQARMLSPTGRCRAFDAEADGYVRSEACTTVILMHPDKAKRLMPRIRGRLLASGVNSDGAAQQLTVPSAARQEQLLNGVLERSARDPEDIDFYEAHGTGTQVGDLAEATGLGRAIGMLRRIPLSIGSAKTNFGHSEPAAGLVGLSKALLSMEHGSVPKSLHFQTPNPELDFDRLNLNISDGTQRLDRDKPVLAGVSSFGFGGTNAAALVESVSRNAPKTHSVVAVPAAPWLRLTAESETSLERLRLLWADRLETSPRREWPALAMAASRLGSLAYRYAIPLTDDAIQMLREPTCETALAGKKPFKTTRTVFAFSGNGAQHATMGRVAYAKDSAYRSAFDEVSAAFKIGGLGELTAYLASEDIESLLESPLVAQPLLFACQIAQVRSLQHAGVVPDVLVGHSLGEIAALHIAGAFDLQNAVKILMRRSARFEALRGQGGMRAVAASEADVRRMLSGFDDTLGIAAINSPNSVIVSGPTPMLERFAKARLHGKRVAMVRLGVEVPYHSSVLDPLQAEFYKDLSDIEFHPLALPVSGAAVGRMLRQTEVDAEYLWRNARDPVQFQMAVEALAEDGPFQILEIAPKAVLGSNIRDMARYSGLAIEHCVPPKPDADGERFAMACWAQGLPIEPVAEAKKTEQPVCPLPSYPWDEQEYFSPMSPDGFDGWGESGNAILAGRRMDRDAAVWISEFTPTQPAWVADHVVGDATLLPAAALCEIALSAGATLWPDAALELGDFDILQPADLGKEGVRIRTVVDEASGAVTLFMRRRLSEGAWAELARGTLRRACRHPKMTWPRNLKWSDVPQGFYDSLSVTGLRYGSQFQVLQETSQRGKTRIYGRLGKTTDPKKYCLDPRLLDGAFHSLAVWDKGLSSPLKNALEAGAILVPIRFGKLVWNGANGPVGFSRLDVTAQRARSICTDLVLFDAFGGVIAEIRGVEFALMPTMMSKGPTTKLWQRRQPRWRPPHDAVKWPRGLTTPDTFFKGLGLSKTPPVLATHSALIAVRRALQDTSQIDAALKELLGTSPNLANDARDLLNHQNGSPNFAIKSNTTNHRAIWRVAEKLVQEIGAKWPRLKRLNIAIIGLVDPVVVTRWAQAPDIHDVFVLAANKTQHDYLTAALPDCLLPRLRTKLDPGQADLCVVIDGAVDDAYLKSFATQNAIVLRIDTQDPEQSEPEDETWFVEADDLSVRLCLGRIAKVQTVQGTGLLSSSEQCVGIPDFQKVAGLAGAEVLVHKHLRDESASASLCRLISCLKSLHLSNARPRTLVVWNEGALNFTALAQAVGSVLRGIRNEVQDWALSAIVVEAAPPEALWKGIFDAAPKEPVLHVWGRDVRVERFDVMPDPELEGPNTALAIPALPGGALTWCAARRSRPRAGEVDIEIAATGLNFRDVLWAQGRIPDRLFDIGSSPASMGMECAGFISRVGAGIELEVGQAVMMFAPDAFRRHLIMPADAVFQIPDGISVGSAASIPVAFVTAWESLQKLARLRAGESVLIHGAAGGVGMAAMKVARVLGARIFATAGTPDKRALVRALGAEAVFDSRDTCFADELLHVTKGHGVDVVLNNLAGVAMERSIACLAPFGRFVELGKRDILDGTRMSLRPFLKNLSYFAYDLDQRLASDPQGVQETMSALNKEFTGGALTPLPVTEYDGMSINEAVKDMQSARHVGKIVIAPPRAKSRQKRSKICGAWVIIGGNGGIGLALASALRSAGASEIHLVSRSGALPLGYGPDGEWAMSDPCVTFHKCDASHPEALSEIFETIGPVHGVVHAAMTLRDRLLKDLDAVETSIVIGSKLGVAEALDQALRQKNIRPKHVLFLSSVASYLGNPGQIAYAAANAGLEGIAERRRQDGLAATVLGLGPVRDRGVFAQENAKSRPVEQLKGIEFLKIDEAIKATFDAIQVSPDQDRLCARLDWHPLARVFPSLSDRSFDWLVTDAARHQKTPRDIIEEINALEWPAALALVQAELNEALCSILKFSMDQFDPGRPLSRYGIDSLMAMELRLEVEGRFGSALPVNAMTDTVSALDMAAMLVRDIREGRE